MGLASPPRTYMTERKYRLDQDKTTVYCPLCKKIMSGWTMTYDFDGYWISHRRPNKKKECWATEEQMAYVKLQWEKKYE